MLGLVNSRLSIRTVTAAILIGVLVLSGAMASADAPRRMQFNIEAQALSTALAQFSDQAGLQFTAPGASLSEVRSSAVRGEYSTDDALSLLLKGTGFTYRFVDEGTVAITERETAASEGLSSGAVRLAQAVEQPATGATESAQDAPAPAASPVEESLEEILVTAQKRIERLQDVPVPVTAINANTLADSNQLRLQDYYTRVPGLNFTTGTRGEPFVAIRGITTSPLTNPTVGITVDDVPYGSTSLKGGGFIAPDIDPSDLARIEVLRGPQGTLYGVSSLGGLIKYVTVDPTTDGLSGSIQTGITSVHSGDDVEYNVRGSVNVPLGDTLAVRASGFTHRSPGYVDNPALGIRDVNSGDAAGGRLSGLWMPSDVFSLKLSAVYQERNTDGSNLVYRLPTLQDLQQSYLKGSGWYRTKYQAYSATLSGKLGNIDLISLSGYNVSDISDSVDTSPFFSSFAVAQFGVTGAPFIDHYKTYKFTQEIRLSAPLGDRFEWLLGGFYTDESSRLVSDVLAVDSTTGTTAGVLGHDDAPSTYEEYAGFVDLTVHFTERFDVQVGGRQSHNRQTFADIGTGIFAGVVQKIVITDDPFTYLVTPRFKVSPDLMIYARFASGYRAGGINANSSRFASIPPGYDADTTRNYEVGIKGAVFDRALSYDASLYYIDWKDIQLFFIGPTGAGAFQFNGSSAKSQGMELSVESRPLTGLTLAASMSWNDAELAEDFRPGSQVRGLSGDRLPFSSRFSGNFSVDQEFPLPRSVTGFIGASVSYVGDRQGVFRPAAAPLRQDYPAYEQIDARMGMELGSWRGHFFVTNIADKRGALGGGIGAGISAAAFNYIQPRTFGLSLTKTFDR